MKVSMNNTFKLYELDPKPEDLTMNKLKIFLKYIGGLNPCLLHKTGMIYGWE